MTEYVLATKVDDTVDWLTTNDVQVVEVDFDALRTTTNHLAAVDEIKSLARKVNKLPDSIPWRDEVLLQLIELGHEHEERSGVLT